MVGAALEASHFPPTAKLPSILLWPVSTSPKCLPLPKRITSLSLPTFVQTTWPNDWRGMWGSTIFYGDAKQLEGGVEGFDPWDFLLWPRLSIRITWVNLKKKLTCQNGDGRSSQAFPQMSQPTRHTNRLPASLTQTSLCASLVAKSGSVDRNTSREP
jgi:hypothetical protein